MAADDGLLDQPMGPSVGPVSMSLLLRRKGQPVAAASASTFTVLSSSERSGGPRRSSSGRELASFIRSAGTPREDRNGIPDQKKEVLKDNVKEAKLNEGIIDVETDEFEMKRDSKGRLSEEGGRKEERPGWEVEDFPSPPPSPEFPPSPPTSVKQWNPLTSLIRPAKRALDWLSSPKKRPVLAIMGGMNRLPEFRNPGDRGRKEGSRQRKDLPFVKKFHFKNKKASWRKAVEAASKSAGKEQYSIEDKFFANSTLAPKASKRATVHKVLEAANKFNRGLINEDSMKALSSSLQEGGYKSGKAYLVEAKVWRVERGGSWSPAMDRTFKLCKKALDRGQGPANKAPEVPADKRVADRGLMFRTTRCKVKYPFELFLFCMVWMLREIEAAIFQVTDLVFDEVKKMVCLSWPVSKTDPSAVGVKRTLQCLCGEECAAECPYRVSKDLSEKIVNFNGVHSLLAICTNKQGVEKQQVVTSWTKIFGMKVGGHSARRTRCSRTPRTRSKERLTSSPRT